MSRLEVNRPSREDTPTLPGWLAGGHLQPMKMLVRLQMTPLLGSPELGSAWKPLLCVGKVFPPSAERNRRQREGCVCQGRPHGAGFWIIERRQQLLWPGL